MDGQDKEIGCDGRRDGRAGGPAFIGSGCQDWRFFVASNVYDFEDSF